MDIDLKPMKNGKGHQQAVSTAKRKITEEEKERKSLILKASKSVKDLWQCSIMKKLKFL